MSAITESNMVAHSKIILSKCAQFREQGGFIDVRLKVGETYFQLIALYLLRIAIISTPCLLME